MTESDTGIIWLAVHVGPRMEAYASQHLRRQGYHVWYPFERIRRRKKLPNRDQFKIEWIEVPHFARYIFVALTKPGQSVYAINETDGVSTVVYCGSEPLPIPHRVMDELMARADKNGCVGAIDKVSRKRFQAGQQVRFVETSPFAGLIAEIEQDAGSKTRVWLESFKNPVEVDPDLLEPVTSEIHP